MTHIFISYSRKNELYAKKLAKKLQDEGFDVWIDNRIKKGDDWWRSIVLALRECAAIIVILTPDADASQWVKREILLADKYSKPAYPLLLAGSLDMEIALFYAHIQITSVYGDRLPPVDFYTALDQFCPRKSTSHGQIVIDVNTDLIDDVTQNEIDNPPETETKNPLVEAKEQPLSGTQESIPVEVGNESTLEEIRTGEFPGEENESSESIEPEIPAISDTKEPAPVIEFASNNVDEPKVDKSDAPSGKTTAVSTRAKQSTTTETLLSWLFIVLVGGVSLWFVVGEDARVDFRNKTSNLLGTLAVQINPPTPTLITVNTIGVGIPWFPPTATTIFRPLPTFVPLTLTTTPVPVIVRVSATEIVRHRAGPGTGYEIVGTSKPGDRLIIVGRNDILAREVWYEVQDEFTFIGTRGYSVDKGWIRSDFITLEQGSFSTLSVTSQ